MALSAIAFMGASKPEARVAGAQLLRRHVPGIDVAIARVTGYVVAFKVFLQEMARAYEAANGMEAVDAV